MRIRVLGSAAGGGFPQWNCNCRQCDGVRHGTLRARARTQSSIAVRGASGDWALVNASPDLGAQLRATAALQPGRAPRDTGIAAVVLADAQVDHVTGLWSLRELGRPLPVWCTDAVFDDLQRGHPILSLLAHYCGVARHRVPIDGADFVVPGVDGLRFQAVPLASAPPPWSPRREAPAPGDNVGLSIVDEASGARLFHAPGLGARSEAVDAAMRAADCVLVDGTFWTDDEMIHAGFSRKTARSIGHLPQSGAGGMLEWLDTLPARTRRVLIHVNNTNPILDEDSPERAQLARRGVEVAHDGLEILLGEPARAPSGATPRTPEPA